MLLITSQQGKLEETLMQSILLSELLDVIFKGICCKISITLVTDVYIQVYIWGVQYHTVCAIYKTQRSSVRFSAMNQVPGQQNV